MKAFFPHNAVEYFVSYYDYYQPEAYIPSTDTYIDTDLSINEEIDRLRLSAVAALLSGRKDVIIVSSVSCIYGLGSPQDFTANVVELKRGEQMPMEYARPQIEKIILNARRVEFMRKERERLYNEAIQKRKIHFYE